MSGVPDVADRLSKPRHCVWLHRRTRKPSKALDQDDADAEEGRRFKQADVIDEIRVERREDKDQPDDPLE